MGIDLTSAEARPSACLGLDRERQLTFSGFLSGDSDIVSVVTRYNFELVAIDAPLSLPEGLCCLEEGCPCQPRGVKGRNCERKLAKLGILIEWERVQEIASGGAIGRPHLAQAMLEKGYVASTKDAFTRYIAKDGTAYVEREKITPVGAVELILRASGLPVLAHPFTINDPEKMIIEVKQAGLVGIETYYNEYTADQTSELVSLAERYHLITTGGTDYHGLYDASETMIGGANVPLESADRLISLARQRKLKLANL